MLVALVIIAVVGIGLPVVAWATSRRAEAHPERLRPAPGDFDQWLLRRYGLEPNDRILVQLTVLGQYAFPIWEVREAAGSAPLRPELQEAARSLAELVVTGRFRTGRRKRRDALAVLAVVSRRAGLAGAAPAKSGHRRPDPAAAPASAAL